MACAAFHELVYGSGIAPVSLYFLEVFEDGERSCHAPVSALQNE
jgi:hypothetical protein